MLSNWHGRVFRAYAALALVRRNVEDFSFESTVEVGLTAKPFVFDHAIDSTCWRVGSAPPGVCRAVIRGRAGGRHAISHVYKRVTQVFRVKIFVRPCVSHPT